MNEYRKLLPNAQGATARLRLEPLGEHLRRQGVAEQHAIVIVGNDCLRGETVDDFECVGRGGQGL